MSPRPKTEADGDEMLPEYDFTGAVRGKYYDRYREGTNVIVLDPDVAKVFRDARAVNNALRLLVSGPMRLAPERGPRQDPGAYDNS